jgi:hypothetical protein
MSSHNLTLALAATQTSTTTLRLPQSARSCTDSTRHPTSTSTSTQRARVPGSRLPTMRAPLIRTPSMATSTNAVSSIRTGFPPLSRSLWTPLAPLAPPPPLDLQGIQTNGGYRAMILVILARPNTDYTPSTSIFGLRKTPDLSLIP